MESDMAKLNLWLTKVISVAFIGSTVLGAGCFKLDPASPEDEALQEKVVQSNVGPIKLLRMDPTIQPGEQRSKGDSAEDQTETFVKADQGGKLEVGSGRTGKSKIEFKKHDLPIDVTVSFDWADGSVYQGSINCAEATGLVFNKPVEAEFSYKWAHLQEVDESQLGLYYYNPATAAWELLPDADINSGAKRVRVKIERFGEFGIFENQNGTLIDLFKRDPNVYYVEKFIKAKKGGKVEVGAKDIGTSKLEFKKDDLPEDVTIAFEWAAAGWFEGFAHGLEFSPHGIEFNNPVKLQLTYKSADLTGIDEANLQLFFYNEETDEWELIGGSVDKKGKKIEAFIKHFSRYAISIGN